MPSSPIITAFAGSLRRDSFNKRLAKLAADAARKAGADVHFVDLRDYPMPVFDEDIESSEGPPETAVALKELLVASDGLLIASPEYNSSITAVLKNTIDWASRKSDDQPSLAAFRGKTAAIMSASPGGLGGLRGLVHLRAILGNIGVLVLPDQLAVSQAHSAFDGDGNLKDEKQVGRVQEIAARLVDVAGKLRTTESQSGE